MKANGRKPPVSTDRRKVAIFLGAGASKPLGLPLTSEIFPALLTKLKENELFEKRYDFHEELRRSLHAISPLLQQNGTYEPDITELLSLIDHFIASGRSIWKELPLRELHQLRDILVAGICEILYQPSEKAKAPGIGTWRSWIGKLVETDWRRVDVAFITTNYDRIIEDVLWDKLGYDNIGTVDFGLDWLHTGDELELERIPDVPRVRLYKLHGSLNVVGCPECERIYISKAPNYFVPFERKRNTSSCHCGHHPLRHVLVAPSLARETPFPRLREIWRRAGDFLRQADSWIIAGYSMPPEDLAVKNLLLTSLHRSEAAGRVRIDVVQATDNCTAAHRYRLYFGARGNVTIYGGGLQRYVVEDNTVFSDLRINTRRSTGHVKNSRSKIERRHPK